MPRKKAAPAPRKASKEVAEQPARPYKRKPIGGAGKPRNKRESGALKDLNAWRSGMFDSFGADGLPAAFGAHPGRCVKIADMDEFMARLLAATPEELEAMASYQTPDHRSLSARVLAYVKLVQDSLSHDPKTRSEAMKQVLKLTHPVKDTLKVVFDDDPFAGIIDAAKSRFVAKT